MLLAPDCEAGRPFYGRTGFRFKGSLLKYIIPRMREKTDVQMRREAQQLEWQKQIHEYMAAHPGVTEDDYKRMVAEANSKGLTLDELEESERAHVVHEQTKAEQAAGILEGHVLHEREPSRANLKSSAKT
jgi:hypothetical protein